MRGEQSKRQTLAHLQAFLSLSSLPPDAMVKAVNLHPDRYSHVFADLRVHQEAIHRLWACARGAADSYLIGALALAAFLIARLIS